MVRPIRIELPTIYGMGTVNCYLFKEPEVVLVDCGEYTDKAWAVLEASLRSHNLSIRDISKLVITHAHVDHIGMAGKVLTESQAQLLISEYAMDWATDLVNMQKRRFSFMSDFIEQLTGEPDSGFSNMFKVFMTQFKDTWTEIPLKTEIVSFKDKDSIEFGGHTWNVVYLPGHCVNQTGFYQKESKQLLAADMILRIAPTPVIDISLTSPDTRSQSIHQMLMSYSRVRSMDIDIVYPGHYSSLSNHVELIDRQVERIHTRKYECLELIKSGDMDFMSLLNGLYRGRLSPPALPMLVGYLDLLLEEGRITKDLKGKKVIYSPE